MEPTTVGPVHRTAVHPGNQVFFFKSWKVILIQREIAHPKIAVMQKFIVQQSLLLTMQKINNF